MPSAGIASNGRPDPDVERRQRIAAAMVELVVEQGYGATTVAQLLERARVSRAELRRLFAGKQACFLAVYDEIAESFTGEVLTAFGREEAWRDGLRAAAYAAARWVAAHPREARYATVETMMAGEFAVARREATLRRFVDLVDTGRGQLEDPDSVSRAMAEGVVGGILGTLTKNMRRGTRARPKDFVPELMFLAVRPYLGLAVAREELSIPPPPEPGREPLAERG
ncbi:MAG TPA: TetR/AcrR family transcriptional regulator [Solirubrobacterales bacterium]|nr:TetR/AcrR family transcriptional regulator [Solirubrobacterales bacterium]